jgi:hypothetical protein
MEWTSDTVNEYLESNLVHEYSPFISNIPKYRRPNIYFKYRINL